MIYLGQIGPNESDIADPLRLGRAKLLVPAFSTTTTTHWAWRLQMPGTFFGPENGMNVLVLAIRSRPHDLLFWLGPIDKIPDGVSSTPRADEYSVAELPRQKIMDFGFAELIADATGNQLFIGTRPPGNPARITFDSNAPRIDFLTGGNDMTIDGGGDRLAMVGDMVVVQGPDGPLSGQIVSGSVPAQSRFPF